MIMQAETMSSPPVLANSQIPAEAKRRDFFETCYLPRKSPSLSHGEVLVVPGLSS
jgi:hypothetical protein